MKGSPPKGQCGLELENLWEIQTENKKLLYTFYTFKRFTGYMDDFHNQEKSKKKKKTLKMLCTWFPFYFLRWMIAHQRILSYANYVRPVTTHTYREVTRAVPSWL